MGAENMCVRMSWRRAMVIALVATILVPGQAGLALFAQQGRPIPPQVEQAIDRGLQYLAESQRADGSWGSPREYTTAITSLSALALMACGHLPGRGKYGPNVSRGVDYLLQSARPSGYIAVGNSNMYNHGLSTLCLAEVLGESDRREVRDTLQKAVDLIVNTQNRRGGWRYQPRIADDDLSVTVMQLMALRAARNVGIGVPIDTIERAASYVRSCANKDGGFAYIPGGSSGFSRTGAGVCSLQVLGYYDAAEIKPGLDYLMAHKDDKSISFYYYGLYYSSYGMYQAGGEYWRTWYDDVSRKLLAMQNKNGSWRGEAGNEYGTAVAVLVLAIPHRYLPIYQR